MDRIISFILCLAFCCSYFTIRCIYIISKEVLSNFVAPAFGLEEEKEASSVLLKIPKRNQSYLNSSQEVLSPRPLKFHRTPQSLNNYTRGRYRGSLAYFAPYFQYLTLKCKAFLMAGEQETSILQIADKEVEEYHWNFVIPPKSRVQENINAIANGGFCFSELKFKRGLLGQIPHDWGFAIYANQVNLYLSMMRRIDRCKITLLPSKLELISKGEVKAIHMLRFHSDECTNNSHANANVLWSSCWKNTDQTWDDSIDLMKVTLVLQSDTLGKCIRPTGEPEWKRNSFTVFHKQVALQVDAVEYFLSKELSDAVITCGEQEFPVHRFLLSCKSSVFNRMFQSEMKESAEGRIKIDDIEPVVLKEMLRYLYCGSVENNEGIHLPLFIAADKYDIKNLKTMCEIILTCQVTPVNALEMYTVGEMHGGLELKKKSLCILKKNKREVVQDSSSFQEFTLRYPELMFELYKL